MTLSGLEQVLMALRPALERFIASRGILPGDVEDVFQDLFLRLRTNPPGPVDEPRAYLYRMADNIVIDRKRSVGRRQLREAVWDGVQPGRQASFTATPDAERVLATRQEIEAVMRAISALSERTRMVFRRFRLEDRGQREIAAELGISLSAVEKHLQRAYHAIVAERRRLDAEVGEGLRLGGEGASHDGE